jgi:hypothetical protein
MDAERRFALLDGGEHRFQIGIDGIEVQQGLRRIESFEGLADHIGLKEGVVAIVRATGSNGNA